MYSRRDASPLIQRPTKRGFNSACPLMSRPTNWPYALTAEVVRIEMREERQKLEDFSPRFQIALYLYCFYNERRDGFRRS
jgi:hypothetical protein